MRTLNLEHEGLFSIGRASLMLKLSRSALHDAVHVGKVPTVFRYRNRYIEKHVLDELLQKKRKRKGAQAK